MKSFLNSNFFVVVVFLFIFFSFSKLVFAKDDIKENLSSEEAYRLIQKNLKNKNFVVLDVRTEEEFRSFRIKNSVNLNFYSRDFLEKINKLDKKNTVYLVYCRTGRRSREVFKVMKNFGFEKVYNLKYGLVDWHNKGYEIEK